MLFRKERFAGPMRAAFGPRIVGLLITAFGGKFNGVGWMLDAC